MKRTIVLLRFVLFVSVLQLTSCKKFIDQYFPHGNNGNKCNITSIKQGFDINGPFRTGTFTYNNAGFPLSAVFDVTGSASPSYYFKYHNQTKLTQLITTYAPGDTQSVHNYSYENGRIATDSAVVNEAGQFKYVSTLEYDNQGRIVEEVRNVYEADGNPVSESTTYTYEYDDNGNLKTSLNPTYDNKVSYLRTNKIWMFIERNYSRNNAQTATQYNDKDLPLGFSSSVSNFLGMGDPFEIVYSCD